MKSSKKQRTLMTHGIALVLALAMLCLVPAQALAANEDEQVEQVPVSAESMIPEDPVVTPSANATEMPNQTQLLEDGRTPVDAGQNDASVVVMAAAKNGWYLESGYWYYYVNGVKKTGWLNTGGTDWYYLDASGRMMTGWLKYDGSWFYLDPSSGKTAFGWRLIDGYWYYFRAAPSGRMEVGWLVDNGKRYYLLPSAQYGRKEGSMLVGGYNMVNGEGRTQYNYFDSGGVIQHSYTVDSNRLNGGTKNRTYMIHATVSKYQGYYRNAFSKWNATGVSSFSETTSSSAATIRCFTVASDTENRLGWCARVNLGSNNIYSNAHVYMNIAKTTNRTDAKNLITAMHEIGHAFALHHTTHTYTDVLHVNASSDTSHTSPRTGDIQGVKKIYGY